MNKKRIAALEELCRSLHIEIKNLELLDMALTHTSYAYEAKIKPRPMHNQRLEFLGDSVLSLVVSTYIYEQYRDKDEGYLSKLRAFLVCEGTIGALAKEMQLDDYLLVGKGELQADGQKRISTLADAFEAVMGAYYLDQGLSKVEDLLFKIMLVKIATLVQHGIDVDYKTHLQEEIQKNGVANIEYEELKVDGPAHDRVFTMRVIVNGDELGCGSGHTKKEAEQHAAKEALRQIKDS